MHNFFHVMNLLFHRILDVLCINHRLVASSHQNKVFVRLYEHKWVLSHTVMLNLNVAYTSIIGDPGSDLRSDALTLSFSFN